MLIDKSEKKGKNFSSPFFTPAETYFLPLFFLSFALGFSGFGLSFGLGSGFFAISVHL